MSKAKSTYRKRGAAPTQMQKVKARAMTVTPDQVMAFPADHRDHILAEAVLQGFSLEDMAAFTGMSQKQVRDKLLDPVRCAWMSQYIDQMVPTRLGRVLGAVFARACSTGDPAAATMLLKQYRQWHGQDVKKSVNYDVKMDLSHFTDEELRKIIKDQVRRNPQVKDIIDVDVVVKESPNDG